MGNGNSSAHSIFDPGDLRLRIRLLGAAVFVIAVAIIIFPLYG